MINEERAGGAQPPRPEPTRNGLTAAGNPIRRIGVLLTAAEWSILFEALRRFAMQNEAAGRPDRARLTQRVLSKLTIYRLAAGVDAVEDEEERS